MTPIFATERNAARLLDMKPPQFCALVEAGSLPPGKEIAPGVVRWYVPDLVAILNGDATSEEFQW
ncbi:hypothetical protein [Rhodophyticola porphyridii]|uniref:DNA-binding protein n=1 Tax=Rhodophyticola porphyridii TaxID=1852017 RepID=A0A3L9Y035_9RHOB|nr:hypothetical protein [Rhodophyticola porphyridii]RMA42164.1 hypothetical protein D9R08_12020 [Rhodophyticola porphyridii]